MYLQGKFVKSQGFRSDLQNLPEALDTEQTKRLLREMLAGDESAKEALIEGHVRLAFDLVGRYIAVLRNFQMSDDLVATALLAVAEAVEKVWLGTKELYNDNITGVIIDWVHWKISEEIRAVPLIHAPNSTVRHRANRGLDTSIPKCVRLTELDVTDYDPHMDANDDVQRQGWHRGRSSAPVISEIEVQDQITNICHSETELEIAQLRMQGFSDRQVAEHLGLTHWSVYTIRKQLAERLRDSYDH